MKAYNQPITDLIQLDVDIILGTERASNEVIVSDPTDYEPGAFSPRRL